MPVGYRLKRAPFPKGARGFQLQGVSIPNRIRKAPISGGEAQSGRLHEGMAEGMLSSGGAWPEGRQPQGALSLEGAPGEANLRSHQARRAQDERRL